MTEWNSDNPKDAELYTSYFNYHFLKSRQEIITLTTDEPNTESLVLIDSLNQTAGFLGSQFYYDSTEYNKGFDKIDEGILLFPNRLDMRFGKIYALGQISDWDYFTSEIIKTIRYSSTNNNNWTWTDNVIYDGGENDFLLSIQDYQLQLFNTEDDELLKNMREIANEVLNHYPKHIPSLSNISITYLLTGEYDKGIETLLKAERIDPKDYIILSNIAHGYKLKGDKEKAIDYYDKVIEFGNNEAKQFAKQQIEGLKK